MSANKNKIDTALLHQELIGSIHEAKLYKIRNDAKIRAIGTAASYDEFRDIVAAAHLTPLTKDDKKGSGTQRWNKAIHK